MINPATPSENQRNLERLRRQAESGKPLTREQSLHPISGLQAVLRFPAATRDMVSRGYVHTWLNETAGPPLSRAGADAL